MELKQLEYFAIVCEKGSFNQAASCLYTSQPNVSRVIHSLEAELGRKLFLRSNRGLEITPYGETVREYASIIVFQDYTTSANPRFRVRDIIIEGLRVWERREKVRLNRDQEVAQLLELVGLSPEHALRFPHELSGGQLQRVCIARAVACKPEIILFDEAISSLDAHTQVQIMDLLRQLKEKLGLTYLFITHDLTSITYLCDQVLFLYHGRVTEHLPVERLAETQDDYARKLLHAIITYDTARQGGCGQSVQGHSQRCV